MPGESVGMTDVMARLNSQLSSGQLVFPTPNTLRSPFRKHDGSYDWETEMTFGWDLIDSQYSILYIPQSLR